jgi:HEAT repeat protein
LNYVVKPESEPTLREALTDSNAIVRLYAVDALGMLTPPADDPLINELASSDQNRDVKSHAQFVLERDDEPDLEGIREELAEYDPAQIATAQLNEEAPDFELKNPLGNAYKLSDFRGKKSVVLVFVYGDT